MQNTSFGTLLTLCVLICTKTFKVKNLHGLE